jgi:hypothetical protein
MNHTDETDTFALEINSGALPWMQGWIGLCLELNFG